MATPGRVSARIILCDFAQASPDGKLTLVGAGWSFTNPGPSVLGVGVLVELDHDEMSKSHTWELVLRDADGRPVNGPGGQSVRLEGRLTPAPQPGHPLGMPFKAGLALNLFGIALPPDGRFQLVLTIDKSFVVIEDLATRPATPHLKAS